MILSLQKIAAATTAFAVLSLPVAADAATNRRFSIVNNNAQVSVQRVWTAAAGTKDPWNETYLNYPIKPKTSSNFTFPDGNSCLYDIKVQFSDGYVQTFANVNVCRGDRVQAT